MSWEMATTFWLVAWLRWLVQSNASEAVSVDGAGQIYDQRPDADGFAAVLARCEDVVAGNQHLADFAMHVAQGQVGRQWSALAQQFSQRDLAAS